MRQKQYDNLTQTSVMIEADLLKELRASGYNISQILREAAYGVLNRKEYNKRAEIMKKFEKVPEVYLRKACEILGRNPGVIDNQTRKLNEHCAPIDGFDPVTPNELMEYVNRNKLILP